MTRNAITTEPTPAWVRDAGKPWKFRNASRLFSPKPFDVGDIVTWRDHRTGAALTGQVWSWHQAPKTRWVVANGNAYAVHERDLLT